MHVFAPQTARTHFGQDIKTDEQTEDSQMDLLWTRSRAIRPRPVQSLPAAMQTMSRIISFIAEMLIQICFYINKFMDQTSADGTCAQQINIINEAKIKLKLIQQHKDICQICLETI